eukprot:1536366-Pleurochrysis_carterae.AAC.1
MGGNQGGRVLDAIFCNCGPHAMARRRSRRARRRQRGGVSLTASELAVVQVCLLAETSGGNMGQISQDVLQ